MFRNWFQKEEDLHISVLRFVLKNPGATPMGLIEKLLLDSREEKIFLLNQFRRKEFFEEVGQSENLNPSVLGNDYYVKYMLSFEGRSRLLEYDELKEARENARSAFWMALLALVVSTLGVILEALCS